MIAPAPSDKTRVFKRKHCREEGHEDTTEAESFHGLPFSNAGPCPNVSNGAVSSDAQVRQVNVQEVLLHVLSEHAGDSGPALCADGVLLASVSRVIEQQWQMGATADGNWLRERMAQCFREAGCCEGMEPSRQCLIVDALTARLLLASSDVASTALSEGLRTEGTKRQSKRRRLREQTGPPRVTGFPHVLPVVASGDGLPPVFGSSGSGILSQSTPLPSVFSQSAVCPVRCLTFERLPRKYCAKEALKWQLSEMCSRIPNAYFISVNCNPSKRRAIVSFNSNEVAAGVQFIVNASGAQTTAVTSGTENGSAHVRVSPSTAEEQQVLWAHSVKRVRAQEEEWTSWHRRYMEVSPHRVCQEWAGMRAKEAEVDEQLCRLSSGVESPCSADDAQGQMLLKLALLQNKLECKNQVALAEMRMRELYGDEYAQHLRADKTVATYSSSAASASDAKRLLFVRNLPCRLDDNELIQFLKCISMQPVHIWRDPLCETTVCVELPTPSHVFAVLHLLDGTNMCFAGALISRERRAPT
ncbi:hypothetical protein ERJ75_001527200 [Trypanosoma vivax]|nr:hypothetical protein TRVL_02864 [Trypanosoma vivax]KAH8606225.1 hypothetical protein ERJ75_001527200 [Trypanosoma vivax]